jgi:hypothetical protein
MFKVNYFEIQLMKEGRTYVLIARACYFRHSGHDKSPAGEFFCCKNQLWMHLTWNRCEQVNLLTLLSSLNASKQIVQDLLCFDYFENSQNDPFFNYPITSSMAGS